MLITAWELGIKDGTRAKMSQPKAVGLALAHIIGEEHWKHVQHGRLIPTSAVEYGRGFLYAFEGRG